MGRTRRDGDRAPRRIGATSVVRPSVGEHVAGATDRAVESRWAGAQERARELDGDRDERVAAVTALVRRELGLAGAATGGAAAVPGVGLGTVGAAFAVEIGWSTVRLTDMIMTIAAIHGHDRAGFEERRTWVLSILTYGDGAAGVVSTLVGDIAGAPGRRGVRRLSERSLRQVNAALGRVVVRRYGARTGVAVLGRAVPFGIGAAVGYGINSRAVSTVSRHAHGFFTEFPISLRAIDIDA